MLNKSGVICLDHLVHQIPGISVNTRNTAAYTNDDASIRQNRQNNGFFFFSHSPFRKQLSPYPIDTRVSYPIRPELQQYTIDSKTLEKNTTAGGTSSQASPHTQGRRQAQIASQHFLGRLCWGVRMDLFAYVHVPVLYHIPDDITLSCSVGGYVKACGTFHVIRQHIDVSNRRSRVPAYTHVSCLEHATYCMQSRCVAFTAK